MKKLFAFGLLGICLFLILNLTPTALATTNHIVISEVQIAGTGGANEDFVELYNPTETSYNLNGHRLVKRTAAGTVDASIKSWNTDTFIPAHGFYLWANSSWTPVVIPDTITSQTLAIDNGIALRQGAENTGTIIDSVAWGTTANAFVETSPYPTNPTTDQSIERKPGENDPLAGNGEDTDNNANDFLLRSTSEPQNSSSTIEPALATPLPSPLASPTPPATPQPTASPNPTPSVSPLATPQPTPHASPSVTPSVLPTPSSSPSPSPLPEPSPLIMRGPHFVCSLYWKEFRTRWFTFSLPRLSCTKI